MLNPIDLINIAMAAFLLFQGVTYTLLPNWWRLGLVALAAVNIGVIFI